MPEALEAGRVGRPHGLDGSFYVTRPDPRLMGAPSYVIGGVPRTIVRRAGTDARPILRIEGVGSREAAEALRGAPLLVPADAVPDLEPDEWWAGDLEGCTVVDGARPVGVVTRFVPLPSCEALEVRREDGPDLLVPLVRDAVRSVDVAAKRIDIDLGFVDP